jgi:carbon monoxide dehydrogenase subunit G
MVKVALTIQINRPIEQVFSYVTNRTNLSEWFAGVQSVQCEEPHQVGAQATITARMMGFTMKTTSVLAEYAPPHRFAIRGSQPFTFYESETFTSVDSGTQIDYEGVYDTRGFYRLLDPLLHGLLNRQLATSYAGLKTVLESRPI